MSCWSWAVVWPLTLGCVHLEPQLGLNTTCCFTGEVLYLGRPAFSWRDNLTPTTQLVCFAGENICKSRIFVAIHKSHLQKPTWNRFPTPQHPIISNVTSSHILIYQVALFAFQLGPLLMAIPVLTHTTANKEMKPVVDSTARGRGDLWAWAYNHFTPKEMAQAQ